MKSYKFLTTGVLAASLFMTSCVNDLDVQPIDPEVTVSSQITDNPAALEGTLAKLYSSFAIPGQKGVSGTADIAGIDNGFGVYTRALWMLQELTTDEALCAWNDQTIKDYHYQTWTAADVFNAAMYSRIIYTVSICNEFVRNTSGNSDAKVVQMNSEARFLRALAYYHAIDMYGNPAFITEADKPGSFFPLQTTRAALFAYVESELKAIETTLGEPKFEYGRADKGAAWMLLARLYLNAKVYVGTDRSADCITYATKVIASNAYTLAPNYRLNFSADNNTSPEMIFSIAYDGVNTQAYGGTGYIIHAATGGSMSIVEAGVGSGWGGNRTTSNFVSLFNLSESDFGINKSSGVDTAHWYLDYPQADKRALFYFAPADVKYYKNPGVAKEKPITLFSKQIWDITNVGTFTEGIAVRKFVNSNADGTQAYNYHNDFASTDYPIFRLSDAYLMRAEAQLRSGGDLTQALADVNLVRERAFGGNSGDITAGQLTLPFMLDERGRELYWEGVRRTDLIRFGQFTNGTYVWQWKGNVKGGQATESYRDLFPIPASEVTSNTNIKQNAGY